MKQLPSWRPRSDDAAHARKAGEKIDMVQQGPSEAGGCIRVVFGDMPDDFG